ncbi:MAG: response regulator transcription factor [Bacteroidetes bacterium]|nr:response regulator transcription factor [Bacteroidota bacterium]MCL5025027.1 response regulator transcription factor [Chloroflexota bacterium]
MNEKLSILLVDDHEVVRIGLRALLSRHPNFQIVGEVGSGDEAVAMARELEPDVVVMDVRMPGGSGIEACRQIVAEHPETRVIMLTSYTEDELLFEAITAGAAGYVLKQIGSDALVKAIEAVGRGESLLDPALTGRVFGKLREAAQSRKQAAFNGLSPQELRILALISKGHTNREIAAEVFLSEKTVRNYVSSIFDKLGLAHRVEAAAYALRHGIDDYVE